jgi:hypothetical protein
MATLLSTPTYVTVRSSQGSALSALAASMAPGTWAQLSVSNQNALLGVGSISGTMVHYCNKMPWNPKSRKIEILAEDHNWGHVRYVQYDEATNQFVLVAADAGFGSATQHGYDHNVVNPYTGDYYYKRAQMSTTAGTLGASRKLLGASGFSPLPTAATNYEQIAVGACWWSGSFAGAGSQGCFMVFNSGDSFGNANDGQIVAFDPLTNQWFFNKHGMAPFYSVNGSTYHSVMEYSAKKNCAVYGGGNEQPNKLWRLNADGSYTAMPNVPSGKAVGIQRGNLAVDPVTGNFLLLSSRELWQLDPSGAGTWTQLTGTRTPPAGVGVPNAPDGVISTSIPEYGVVAYITQTESTGGTFFVYKHA